MSDSDVTSGGQTTHTIDQPHFSLGNIIDHPGSTYAGVGLLVLTLGQYATANPLPVNAAGWVTYLAQLALAIMAAMGK